MYLVFGGEQYYAAGGAHDFIGKAWTKDEAVALAEKSIGMTAILPVAQELIDAGLDEPWHCEIEWAHVFHVGSGEIVASFGETPLGHGKMYIGFFEAE